MKGSVVAVTGAGSGIGRGLAVNLAKGSDPDVSHNELVEIFDTKMAKTSADKAARIIIKGIKKNRQRILVGLDAHIIDILQRLFPVMFQKLAGMM